MPPVFLSHCNREMGSVKMQLLVLGVLFVYVNGKYIFMGTKDIKNSENLLLIHRKSCKYGQNALSCNQNNWKSM